MILIRYILLTRMTDQHFTICVVKNLADTCNVNLDYIESRFILDDLNLKMTTENISVGM